MEQVLQQIEPELRGHLDVLRVDTDIYRQEAARWRLRMVPTQLLVNAQGKELWRHEGYITADDLRARISELVGGLRSS